MKYSGSTYYTDYMEGGSIEVVQREKVMVEDLIEAGNPQEGEQNSRVRPVPKTKEIKDRRLHGFISI